MSYDKVKTITQKELEISYWVLNKVKELPHSEASFFGHLYNVFFILKQINADENTCIAGLCHSLYGTEFFKYKTVIERDELKNIIGEESENLVYLFSLKNRFKRIVENTDSLDKKTVISLLQILYANEVEQIGRGSFIDEDHKKHHFKVLSIINEKLN
jgi:hypothetical protein